jgi:hypothetical protein
MIGWHRPVTAVQQPAVRNFARKKVTRPGGRPGGSGYDTGWMRPHVEHGVFAIRSVSGEAGERLAKKKRVRSNQVDQ